MLLARQCARVLPSCSASALGAAPHKHTTPVPFQQRRAMSDAMQIPGPIQPLFQYAADCNITAALQNGMEGLHAAGLPWAGAFVVAGLGLRLATAPLHIYAEKLFAKRLHATNFFTQALLKKLGAHYRVEVGPNAAGTQLELKTNDEAIKKKATELLTTNVHQYLGEHKLQASRIQNLKMCTVPVWIFSSFALRNVISSDFHPSISGGLWVPDLLVPDPYFILPVAVGLFGFLNLWSQRKIYPVAATSRSKAYDAVLAFFTLFAVHIMSQLPACIPLYWLMVSMSGMAQAQLLRHPRVKGWLGIQRLPTDSSTPLRDLFLTSRK